MVADGVIPPKGRVKAMETLNPRLIYEAKRRIGNWIWRTPLKRSRGLSHLIGGDVWLKLENQQVTGSFKPRGVANKLLKLKAEGKTGELVTSSSGNHALALGHLSRLLGFKAVVVVPRGTPRVKVDAIRSLGVELRIHGSEYMEAEAEARRLSAEENRVFISPYNDVDVIAGHGTIALELLEDQPHIDEVLVPVGGGGLISGIAAAIKALSPGTKVIGVQPSASPVMYESLKRGRIVELEIGESIAEALLGGIEADSITFNLCRRYVDDFIIVDEPYVREAVRWMLLHERQVAEGGGAIGVAALLSEPKRFRGERIAVVVSGGNIDPELLRELIKG